jgi:cyclic-di-GMP phosphodiesterase TipF (flagellum assembly factor)
MKSSLFAGLLAYAALAAVTALALPQIVEPGLLLSPQSLGVAVGAVVFVAATLIHEIFERRAQAAAQRQSIVSLGQAMQRLARRLQVESPEIKGLQAAELETMVAEMKVLKSLVEQLSVKRESGFKPPVDVKPVVMKTPVVPSTAEPLGIDAAPAAKAKPAPAPGTLARTLDLRIDPGERALPDRPVAARPLTAGGGEPPPIDFSAMPRPHVEPDPAADEEMLDKVREALSADRVDLYLQPIVSLPQRKTRHYQCSATIRLPDGSIITPEQYKPVAERAGLIATIDNMLLVRCVQLVRRARRQKQPVGFFCDIAGDTLRDREFFADFLAFMRENSDLAGHLMFGLTQHDLYRLDPRTEAELEQLAKIGFRFCMEETTNLDLFVADLSKKGFRYIKVAAGTLIAKLPRDGDPRVLKRALDPGAIDLIVSGIDTDAMLLDLLDYAIDFGQGALFGPPHPDDYR